MHTLSIYQPSHEELTGRLFTTKSNSMRNFNTKCIVGLGKALPAGIPTVQNNYVPTYLLISILIFFNNSL